MILSVGIVAKNEENYLERLFEDILNQTCNLTQIEVIFVDSMSTDKTYRIMNELRKKNLEKFFDIRILKNEKETQASGWNKVIKEFRGTSLTRIDAHSSVDKDFFKNVIEALNKGEYVVGGPRLSIIENKDRWSNLLYVSETSMFGSGIASYRKQTDVDSYKKTMFHATYKREVLEKVGFFNEELGRTEDNDFHFRVREAGYKLFFTSKIKSYQYVRPTLRKMINQKYGNGYWIGRTLFVQPKCLSIFHFVPFMFILALTTSFLLSIFGITNLIFCFILFSYGLFCFITAITSMITERNLIFILLPFIFFALHFSYGFGTLIGLLKGIKLNA